ncbi:MAG: hypothetical protein ACRECH_00375 [Nitrososphaerales archaeon]
MGERKNHLPEFSPAIIVSNGYYVNSGGSQVSIGSGWNEESIMQNGQCYPKIALTGPSGGSFTETWQTSCGT